MQKTIMLISKSISKGNNKPSEACFKFLQNWNQRKRSPSKTTKRIQKRLIKSSLFSNNSKTMSNMRKLLGLNSRSSLPNYELKESNYRKNKWKDNKESRNYRKICPIALTKMKASPKKLNSSNKKHQKYLLNLLQSKRAFRIV